MECAVQLEKSSDIPQRSLADYGSREKELGRGTYGVVSKYSKNGLDVAIKKMNDDDGGVRSSTLREIACTIRLIHPNVVTTLDVIGGKKDLFLVMAMAKSDAKSLPIDPFADDELKKDIIYQVVLGIGYCLSRGVINRDIKPQNILVYPGPGGKPQLKIADFGLARTYMCSYDSGTTNEVYTIWYRPPEVLLGAAYTDSADIWAMGCTLYELCRNTPLFPGETESKMLMRINREFGNLETQWPNITDTPNWSRNWTQPPYHIQYLNTLQPPDLQRIIRMMIQVDPDKRKSASEIIKDPYFDGVRDSKLDALLLGCSCTSTLLLREFPSDRSPFDPATLGKVMILENWLGDIHHKFKLSLQDLMLAMELVEIVCKLKKPNDSELQKIGCACLFISAKYYEIYSPTATDYVYMSSDAFTENQLLETEKMILETIKYDLFRTTSADFLYSYLKAGNYDRDTKRVAKSLLPIVHIFSPTKGLVFPKNEALCALYIACSHTGCSFKHTVKLDDATMRLVTRIYTILKDPTKEKYLKTFNLAPGEIMEKDIKVL